MRSFLIFCAAAAALAMAAPALAATKAPASGTTIVIKIPAMPSATSARALKKAMKGLSNFSVHVSGQHNDNVGNAPPGVLRFSQAEVNRSTNAEVGKVVSLYPARLSNGQKGHLILMAFGYTNNTFGIHRHPHLTSVVQPDSNAFSLHRGEQVVLVRSTVNGWARVLPYKGPKPNSKR
jgi:hypothetical protein